MRSYVCLPGELLNAKGALQTKGGNGNNKIKEGLEFVENNDAIVTLGINPTRPDTGYGYIQYLDEGQSNNIYKVKTFTEKPTLEIAQTFLDSGDFLWNAGIFVWSGSTIRNAFKEYLLSIKGPLTTPVGGGIRSLNVALRQHCVFSGSQLQPSLWLPELTALRQAA